MAVMRDMSGFAGDETSCSSQRRARILLVDDEASLLAVLADVLRTHGYEVESIGEADAARQAIDTQDYDFYVFDLVMPDASGEELCQAVAARGKDPAKHVILMTGFPLRDKDRAPAASDVPCLLKPFKCQELLQLLARPLDSTG